MTKVPCYDRECKGNCPLNIGGWPTYDVWEIIEKGCNGSSEEINFIIDIITTESLELKQQAIKYFHVEDEHKELILGRWVNNEG